MQHAFYPRDIMPPRDRPPKREAAGSGASLRKKAKTDASTQSSKPKAADDDLVDDPLLGFTNLMNGDAKYWIKPGDKAEPWILDDEAETIYVKESASEDSSTHTSPNRKKLLRNEVSPKYLRISTKHFDPKRRTLTRSSPKPLTDIHHANVRLFAFGDIWPIQPVRRVKFLGPDDRKLMPKNAADANQNSSRISLLADSILTNESIPPRISMPRDDSILENPTVSPSKSTVSVPVSADAAPKGKTPPKKLPRVADDDIVVIDDSDDDIVCTGGGWAEEMTVEKSFAAQHPEVFKAVRNGVGYSGVVVAVDPVVNVDEASVNDDYSAPEADIPAVLVPTVAGTNANFTRAERGSDEAIGISTKNSASHSAQNNRKLIASGSGEADSEHADVGPKQAIPNSDAGDTNDKPSNLTNKKATFFGAPPLFGVVSKHSRAPIVTADLGPPATATVNIAVEKMPAVTQPVSESSFWGLSLVRSLTTSAVCVANSNAVFAKDEVGKVRKSTDGNVACSELHDDAVPAAVSQNNAVISNISVIMPPPKSCTPQDAAKHSPPKVMEQPLPARAVERNDSAGNSALNATVGDDIDGMFEIDFDHEFDITVCAAILKSVMKPKEKIEPKRSEVELKKNDREGCSSNSAHK